jgi:hypothetical protein
MTTGQQNNELNRCFPTTSNAPMVNQGVPDNSATACRQPVTGTTAVVLNDCTDIPGILIEDQVATEYQPARVTPRERRCLNQPLPNQSSTVFTALFWLVQERP